MKNYNIISKEQLIKSVDRRIRHLMVKTLEDFETFFNEIEDSQNGQLFKAQIRTSFNDTIRAQRDELNDYCIEYKPLYKNSDNSLSITRTFLESIEKIEFSLDPKPLLRIYSGINYIKVLNALRQEFEVGIVCQNQNECCLDVAGVSDCISIIPVMDHYSLNKAVKDKYQSWRQELIKLYRR